MSRRTRPYRAAQFVRAADPEMAAAEVVGGVDLHFSVTLTDRTRTYWLSFCDGERPEGQQFLGVVVVDVTRRDAELALLLRPEMPDTIDGPWIGAALQACWQAGVNPGGSVTAIRIDDLHPTHAARYPRLTLMSKATIEALEPPE